ncbi:right-handed parallel beta-helix repeat-containing protein [Neobacillus sp. NPDC093182]|uniref:right-handed parallel beta-helix repeat-containing protein n=1 Tax=Neobacillus sp. NPDC093182 TaxID=3364297 RepID=UPI003816BC74
MVGGSYVLELDRWKINNNGTDAINTSLGINNALDWASHEGYLEVIFPKGKYLIDENNPIKPQSNMTLNLGGSTLRIRDNSLQGYSVISFQNNQQYSRITNGKIEGDRYTHDYSIGGTHEGGYGIQIGSFTPPANGGNNTKYISIDNLEIFNCTGDAISLNSTFGQIFPTPVSLANSWETGGISTTNGTLTNNPNKIRSKLKIEMNQPAIIKYGYFGLYGNGFGNLGSDIISDFYDIIFYKSDNSFLSTRAQVQFFEEVEVPIGANFARIVLHQSNLPGSNNCLINVRVPSFSQYVFIEKCNLHHCRRQGITIAGAKNIYLRNNHVHHIDGTPPQAAIDIEDGYDLNQYIYISQNNFHDNRSYNVIVVNGKKIFIENNRFSNTLSGGASLAVNAGADKVTVYNNDFHIAKVILAGNILFSNNNLYATQVSILGEYNNRPINVTDNLFHNCKLIIDNPFSYLVQINGCRFYNDSDKLNAFSNLQWTLELKNKPQSILNCSFQGLDVYYLTYTTNTTFNGGWIFENTTFQNVKNPALLAGFYRSCTFKDIDLLTVFSKDSDILELSSCNIISKDLNNSLITVNNIKSLIIKNCYIEKPNNTLIKIQNITDELQLINNNFKVINNTLTRPIVLLEPSFSGNLINIESNTFTTKNSNQVGIQNSTINNPLIVIRNNILQKSTISTNGKEIIQNNIVDGKLLP